MKSSLVERIQVIKLNLLINLSTHGVPGSCDAGQIWSLVPLCPQTFANVPLNACSNACFTRNYVFTYQYIG